MITIEITQTQMFLITLYFVIMFSASAYIDNDKYNDIIGVIMLLCNGILALLSLVKFVMLAKVW